MKKRRIKIKVLLPLVGFILIAVLTFLLYPSFNIKNFKSDLTIKYNSSFDYEYGSICYGNIVNCDDVVIVREGDVDTSSLGKYDVIYKVKHDDKTLELKQTVNVVDDEEPVITLNNSEVLVCPNGKIKELDITITDNYDDDLSDKTSISVDGNTVLIEVIDSNGNKASKSVQAKIGDDEAPKITLNGKKSVNVVVNAKYDEEGASASDDCDEVEVLIDGNVDTTKVGTYTVKYVATDTSGNSTTEERLVNVYKKEAGTKVVYLTFDDGPSAYTSRLLDVLKKYNVKATFFVTSNGSDAMIKREYDEGHTVALHTYSHNYNIYTSVDAFFTDLYKIQDRVERITGYKSYLMRFAGGSSNTISKGYDGGSHIMSTLVKEVEKRGFTYFDWNVSSGDAGGTTSTEKVFKNVTKNLKSGSSIVLQHDIKGFSVNAVEDIIKYGLDNGYTFKRLEATSPTAHHGTLN